MCEGECGCVRGSVGVWWGVGVNEGECGCVRGIVGV